MRKSHPKSHDSVHSASNADNAGKHAAVEDTEDNEDIDIDFSFMKKWFSSKAKDEKAEGKTGGSGKTDVKPRTELHEKRHETAETAETAETVRNEDAEDDDLELDFSFAKKLFKGKKEERAEENVERPEHAESAGSDRNDAQKEKHSHSEQSDDEDISFDFSFFKKLMDGKYLTIALLLIPLFLTLFIRGLPSELPITDDWAQSAVHNYYRNQIAAQINQLYPNLPDANRQRLVDSEFTKFLETNKAAVREQSSFTSVQFKDHFRYEENGHQVTYLGDLDSYFWLRYAKNYAETGMTCDEIIDGKCIDTYIWAPTRSYIVPFTLHVYGIAWIYSFVHFFSPSFTLMEASFKLPLVLALLATVFAFLIGRKIAGNIGGFFASVIVSVNPIFLSRSLGSDTDVWNITMPLLVFWLFLESFEAKSLRKSAIYAALTSVAITAFAVAWSGWWYVFDFILITVLGYIIFSVARQLLANKSISLKELGKDTLAKHTPALTIFCVLIILTGILISVFLGFSSYTYALTAPFDFVSIKAVSHADLWPNVYTTVAELNEASLGVVVGQAGGKLMFFLALVGILTTLVYSRPSLKQWTFVGASGLVYLYLVSEAGLALPLMTYLGLLLLPVAVGLLMILVGRENLQDSHSRHGHGNGHGLQGAGMQGIDVRIPIMLAIWFAGTIFASTKGVRFVLLLIPAFAIAVSAGIGFFYSIISSWVENDFRLKPWISKTVVFLLLCILLVSPVRAGVYTTRSFLPSINDTWWDSLTYIKENSAPDAIINSWWDFGHWFKYVADRSVTADGATQNSPQAHWLGLVLQTSDEKVAVGVLRMLDCGGNTAFQEMDKKLNDTEKSENVVSEIILLEYADAKDYLSGRGFSKTEAENVLKYTHCSPPENYFITSEDMIGKAGVWAHFGLWDFDRAFIAVNVRGKQTSEAIDILMRRFNYTEQEALSAFNEVEVLSNDQAVNNWIAPWPNYLTGNMQGCSRANGSDTVMCNYGAGIGQQNNQNIVIDRAVINLSRINETVLVTGFYDANTNLRIGENVFSPAGVVIADKTIERTSSPNPGFGYDVLLAKNPDGSYSSLLVDPLLSQSMFTQLFYLDGRYVTHFKKFDDRSGMTGTRVAVWKVDWNPSPASPAPLDDSTETSLADPANLANSSGTTSELTFEVLPETGQLEQ